MTDLTTEKRAKLREQSSRAPWGVWIDIRPEDLLALLDAADERDKLVANPRDEYHTMEELYEYRMLYNALAANAMPDRAVKSWRHSDGEMCFGGGWFVVYLHLPTGQVSNHYKAGHWDLFRVPEVDIPPEWDGHTPAVAADRLRLALAAAEKRGPRHEPPQRATARRARPTTDRRDMPYQIPNRPPGDRPMSRRDDHAALAAQMARDALDTSRSGGQVIAGILAATAQVHATLALVEQQRIANEQMAGSGITLPLSPDIAAEGDIAEDQPPGVGPITCPDCGHSTWSAPHIIDCYTPNEVAAPHPDKMRRALKAVLRIDTGNNRTLYGNDFEAGMAKALWLVRNTIIHELGSEEDKI